MGLITLLIAIGALGLALWCVREIMGLKERWARLYGLRAAMVEAEMSLKGLMAELDKSGQSLIANLESRLDAITGDFPSPSGSSDPSPGAGPRGRPVHGSAPTGDQVDAGTAKTVLHLLHSGHTVSDIAQQLDLPRGEVQLMVDLERFRR